MVRFRLLGPVEIVVADQPVVIARPRPRALLAYLLLAANRLVPMAAIVDAIWGEAPPATARTQVQADVSAIRRAFRTAGTGDPISTTATGYRLDVHGAQIDLIEFTETFAAARTAAHQGDLRSAADLARQALALWRGPAIGDVTASFVDRARAGLEELRLAAIETLGDWELSLGRHRELVAELTTLAREHPLREGLRRQLSLALYRTGRTPDALAELRDLRSTLAEEHGINPTAPISALEVAILRADPNLDAAAPAPPAPPFQQPAVLTDFVGREAELDQMRSLLQRGPGRIPPGSCVIVSIAGMAGVGKTTLAHRIAHEARCWYPDGCLYADLEGTHAFPRDPSAVLSSFLCALGLAGQSLPTQISDRAALYRSTTNGRRMLVVLDNVKDEAQVLPLIPGPGSALLLTSRSHVILPGIEMVDVAGLPTRDALRLLAHVAGAERVDGEPAAAERLVALCGHLPLAVRVAGVRLRQRGTMSVAALADRLANERHRLDELAVTNLDVRASLRLGYQLLEPAPRHMMDLFAATAFPTLTPTLGAALLGGDPIEAERLLEQLCGVNLLVRVADDRYGMHDLVRLHARECTVLAGCASAAGRACQALLDLAQHVNQCLPCRPIPLPTPVRVPSDPPSDALAWFEAEQDNILAAVGLAVEFGLLDLAGHLAAVLANFCMMRGYQELWERSHDLVMAARRCSAPTGQDPSVDAVLHLSLGNLYRTRDRNRDALVSLRRASRLFRANGQSLGLAASIFSRGVCAYLLGRPRVTLAALRSVAVLLQGMTEHPLAGYVLLMHRGRLARSKADELTALSRALEIFNATGESWGAAEANTHLASALRRGSRFAEATTHASQAIEIYAELRAPLELLIAETVLASIYLDQGQPCHAAPVIDRVLASARALHHPWGEATARRLSGQLHLKADRPAQAVEQLEAAAGILREIGHAADLSITLDLLAQAREGMPGSDQDGVMAGRPSW